MKGKKSMLAYVSISFYALKATRWEKTCEHKLFEKFFFSRDKILLLLESEVTRQCMSDVNEY